MTVQINKQDTISKSNILKVCLELQNTGLHYESVTIRLVFTNFRYLVLTVSICYDAIIIHLISWVSNN